jgi:hypothetical protein
MLDRSVYTWEVLRTVNSWQFGYESGEWRCGEKDLRRRKSTAG